MHKNREKNLALKRGFIQKLFKFYGKKYAIISMTESKASRQQRSAYE